MVRDPYWLHAYWELSRSTLARAQAALGQDWHTARPVLRVMDVTSEDTTAASERVMSATSRSTAASITGTSTSSTAPPRSYRIDVGYISPVAASSSSWPAPTSSARPKAGVSDVLDENWASVQEQFQKIYHAVRRLDRARPTRTDLRDLFEERLRRPMHGLSLQSLGTGALHGLSNGFHFEIDAELIVYGATEPNAKVTLQGEPVTAPARRDIHRPVQPARLPPDHPGRRRQPRRRRGTDHRPGRRAQHQGTRTDDPRRQRTLIPPAIPLAAKRRAALARTRGEDRAASPFG